MNEFSPEFEHKHYSLLIDSEMGVTIAASVDGKELAIEKSKTVKSQLFSQNLSTDSNLNLKFSRITSTPNKSRRKPRPVPRPSSGMSGNQKSRINRKKTVSKRNEPLITIKANDFDCSTRFGSVCRYELIPISTLGGGLDKKGVPSTSAKSSGQSDKFESLKVGEEDNLRPNLTIDNSGRVWLSSSSSPSSSLLSLGNRSRRLNNIRDNRRKNGESVGKKRRKERQRRYTSDTTNLNNNNDNYFANYNDSNSIQLTYEIVAYDCGGKKSHLPAKLSVTLIKSCKQSLKGKLKETLAINY